MPAIRAVEAILTEYLLLVEEMEAGLFPHLEPNTGNTWADFVPEEWKPIPEFLQPWFKAMPFRGEGEIFFNAGLSFVPNGDQEMLGIIGIREGGNSLLVNRSGSFIRDCYPEHESHVFDPTDPSSFLGVQIFRWVRWALSCSYWREDGYLGALPGTYFGIEVGTHLEGSEVEGFSLSTNPLLLRKEPEVVRPSIDIPDRICRAWLAAGCPERHIPGS